jgi:hypothetical protein
MLGCLAQRAGQFERARALHLEAAALVEGTEARWFAAYVHNNLGATLERLGEFEAAEDLHRQVVAEGAVIGGRFTRHMIFTAVGGSPVARSMLALGKLARDRGDLAEAERLQVQALARAESIGDMDAIAYGIEALAATALAAAEFQRACALVGAADALRRTLSVDRDAFERDQVDELWRTATCALGSEAAERARDGGREMQTGEALDMARRAAPV